MTLVMAPLRRKLAIILGSLIVLFVGGLAFEQWSTARSFQERHTKWLKEQRPVYDQMATKVMAQRATLSSQPRELGSILPSASRASARTNTDGSVTIIFAGGNGGPRHGYIYHSGALLTKHPGDADASLY